MRIGKPVGCSARFLMRTGFEMALAGLAIDACLLADAQVPGTHPGSKGVVQQEAPSAIDFVALKGTELVDDVENSASF